MPKKSFLITGCDSGFGKMTAISLSKLGHTVFAGCLTEKGRDDLLEYQNPCIHPLILDVTREDHVQAAFEFTNSKCPDGLNGLVNNAGIAMASFVDWACLEDFRKLMEVNYFGVISVTKTFLPLLKKSHGTIVNVSSLAGVVSFPPLTAYSGSKFAMEAFSDGIRREFEPFGIKVAVVEPIVMKTPIVKFVPDIEATWKKLPQHIKDEYGEAFYQKALYRSQELEDGAENPQNVVNTIITALLASKPKPRYVIGSFHKTAPFFLLPTTLIDYLIKSRLMGAVGKQASKL